MEISLYSRGMVLSSLESTKVTSAILEGLRVSVPLKITSVISEARRPLADCSPMTHRTPSETLVLPQPFGPTTAVTPGSKRSSVLSAKDLKPCNSSFLRNKPISPGLMRKRPQKCGKMLYGLNSARMYHLNRRYGKCFKTTNNCKKI